MVRGIPSTSLQTRAMPDAFDDALLFLQQSLGAMKTHGSRHCASTAALQTLLSVTSPAPTPALAPNPSARSAAPAAEPRRTAPPSEERPAPKTSQPPPPTPQPRLAPPSDSRPKREQLDELRDPILACTLCEHLVKSRTQVVFGVGSPDADVMFVGEAPGEDEDVQGEPFVGKAGQLLTKIIETMGLGRDTVYIANVLKCRPDMPAGSSGNRKPTNSEMGTCLPYLERQIAIIQPKVIVALGATAMEGLLGETSPMARLRGRWHDFRGIPLMATYHPAYLLRNQSLGEKRKVWEDMLLVLERLELPISDKQRSFFLAK
jgi:uracil-DNA glycosylase family 4